MRCGDADGRAGGSLPSLFVEASDGYTNRRQRPNEFEPPAPDELAPQFPQLKIVELLGRGGMGAVYKARHRGLDRLVALKILPATSERDPSFAERFTREARALARLNHPNIVIVYDFGHPPCFRWRFS
jgi:eukaryotic-like serine/threonine-protein kinase